MKILDSACRMIFAICIFVFFSGPSGTAYSKGIHLYVMPHGDDIIQISAKIYDDIHSNSAPEIHVLFTENDAASVDKVRGYLDDYLGIDPENVQALPVTGPIAHKKRVMRAIESVLLDLQPDKVFIQGWCGSHPAHEMNHIETVMAAAKAERKAGLSVEIYEFPTFTGAYGRLPSNATIEELSAYWNSLIDLDPEYHAWNEAIPVDESDAALKAKKGLIEAWGIGWMKELVNKYSEEDFQYFISQEKYRLLGDYNYLQRPYQGLMSYEFLHEWPYVFKDLRNYTLALNEKYGADLWTWPEAAHKGEHVWIQPDSVYDNLQVCLENTSDEPDLFTLSASWDEKRIPAGNSVKFASEYEYLKGGEQDCVAASIHAGGFSGYHVLWIKAVSQDAFLESDFDGTYYVEVPFVININYTEPVGKPQKTSEGNGVPGP